jgi:hypothetical protein
VDVIAPLLVIVVLAAVVWLVATPLRGEWTAARSEREGAEVEGLQAAKEAKYREIRDLELDFRMGKLSEADFRTLDRQLRAEAVDILRRLDAAGAEEQAAHRP